MEFIELEEIAIEEVIKTCGSYTSASIFEDEDVA